MRATRVDGYLGREIDVDVCVPCQSIWLDAQENLQLTPGATLALFRVIGENVARPSWQDRDLAHCPRCRAQLRRTQDIQRNTHFEYYRCPNQHGRLVSFFDFLKEKDFVKPLLPHQIAKLREYAQAINCSNCGAPVAVAANARCTHCGSPLTMLDLEQADRLIAQLQRADAGKPIDPAWPLAVARARRDTEAAFRSIEQRHGGDDSEIVDLVGEGLSALMRLIRNG
jgi:Zn-finger nucleic acid-binding protein